MKSRFFRFLSCLFVVSFFGAIQSIKAQNGPVCDTYTTFAPRVGLGSNNVNGVYAVGSKVYAATDEGLSISTDGGLSFTNNSGMNGLGTIDGHSWVSYVYADGSTVYAAIWGGGLSISTDGGASFTNKTTANGLGVDYVRGVYAVGSTVFAATYGGLSISIDGGASFTNKTTANGLGNNYVEGVYAVGSTVYAATHGGLSISTDGGANFTNKTTANGLGDNYVYEVYAVGSTVYAATEGGLSISTDGGANFTNKTTANGLGNNVVYEVYAVGSTVYAATEAGLSISTDGGENFTNKTTTNGLGNNYVFGVYAVGSTVYAATGGGLSISTDGGANFTNKTTSNGLGSNYVEGVYAVGSTVYAATHGGLSISTDGGANFTNKTTANGLTNDIVYEVYAVGSTVYAASAMGLHISTDGGSTFTKKTPLYTTGSNSNIFTGVYATDRKIYVATWNGLLSCSAASTCVNPISGGTIAAAQSGTNPFTPAAFTSSAAASGQTGTLEYKWQSSTTSNSAGFVDIASSNAATYDAGALTQTTWFKRLAKVDCSADWSGAVASNVLEVTVSTAASTCTNPTSGGTIAAAQSGTSPFNPAAFTSSAAASGQTGTLEYKWQSSTTSNSAGFSDISSSNAETYDAGALTQTTWFKRLARVSCSADWIGAVASNVIEVTVSTAASTCTNPTSGGTIAAAQSGYNPFTPAAFTSSVAASGETGTLEYKWQSSTTDATTGFSDIASSNATTYTSGALTVTTWFKRLARVSCSADWTTAVASNVIAVTVTSCINPTAGGTIAAAQSGTSPFTPAAFTSSVAASGQTGIIEYKWQSSTTDATTGFGDIASSNVVTYTAGALSVTTWFKRLARVSCSADWSGAVASNVIEVTVSGGVNTWTGTVSNLWNVAGNWSLGTVPTSSSTIIIASGTPQLNVDYTVGGNMTISGTGTLTVNPGKTLSVAAGGTADFGGKSVTFKSDATVTAQLGQVLGTLSNATNVTMERYIPARRAYRFIAAPATTTTSIKQNWMENATLGATAGYPFAAGSGVNPTAG
ncbi:MAG: hypothetical protein K9I82_13130, partial [Chitinophagaceae bacterium]|nr:hypothetical protein [Chitinophagaceae bacterium]